MFFESSVLFLIVLAFIPNVWLRSGLPKAIALRHWLLLPMALLCLRLVVGAKTPEILIPLVLLGQGWAALSFLHHFGKGGAEGRLAHIAFSALPMFLIVPIFGPGRFFEGARGANFWFLDYVNKLFIAWVEPLLIWAGFRDQIPAVLRDLAPTLEAIARGLPALHMSFELVLTAALYVMVQGWVPSLPTRRSAFEAPLHPGLVVVALFFWIGGELLPDLWPVLLLGQLSWGVFFVFGVGLIHRNLKALRLGESLGVGMGLGPIAALLVVIVFYPPVAHLGVLAGIYHSLRGVARDGSHEDGPSSVLISGGLGSAMARRWGPVFAILGVLIPLKLVGGPVLTLSRAPGLNGPALERVGEDDEGLVHLRGGGRSLKIDALEAPGNVGELPMTGVSPGEAQGWCEGRGLHLCFEEEWAWGCSLGEDRHYITGGVRANFVSAEQVRARCNLGAQGGGIAPSGSHPECENPAGVLDLAGNAWEWVQLRDRQGWWGLAGGYFRYQDEQTPSCAFRLLVHEAQLPALDLDTIGFRCCG